MKLVVLGFISLALFFLGNWNLSRIGIPGEYLVWIAIPLFLSWIVNLFYGIVMGIEATEFRFESKQETKIVPANREETMRIVKELKRKNPETLKLLGK